MSIFDFNSTTFAMAGPGYPSAASLSQSGPVPARDIRSPIPRPAKPDLVGLGFSAPCTAAVPLPAHSRGNVNRFQGQSPSSLQRPKRVPVGLGLGIYIPVQQANSTSRYNFIGDNTALPSPPLLPTHRPSPFHITVILDDDESPPPVSIFTPVVQKSPQSPSYARRPAFMCAPSASELPIPFAQRPSAHKLPVAVEQEKQRTATTTTAASPPPPFLSIALSPDLIFSPLAEADGGIFKVIDDSDINGDDEERTCSSGTVAAPAAVPSVPLHVPSVTSAQSPRSYRYVEQEPCFHLPNNLFVSPDLATPPPAAGRGVGGDHAAIPCIYHTPLHLVPLLLRALSGRL